MGKRPCASGFGSTTHPVSVRHLAYDPCARRTCVPSEEVHSELRHAIRESRLDIPRPAEAVMSFLSRHRNPQLP